MLTKAEERELEALRAERDQQAIERFYKTVDVLAFTRQQIPSYVLDDVCHCAGATRDDLNAAVKRAWDRADRHEQFERKAEEIQNQAYGW